MPPSVARARPQVLHAASHSWATRQGFANAGAVPMHRLGELVQHLAATTQAPADQVREWIFANNFEATPAQAPSPAPEHVVVPQRQVFASAETALPADLKPLTGVGVKFQSAREEFDATRVVITNKATPAAIRQVYQASEKLLARMEELEKTHDDSQVEAEINRSFKELLSDQARRKGILLTKTTPELEQHAQENPGLGKRVKAPKSAAGLGAGASVAVDQRTGGLVGLDYRGTVRSVASVRDFVANYKEAHELDRKAAALEQAPKSLAALRSVSDENLKKLSGDIEHVSLADDISGMTRVYPTRWYKPQGQLMSSRLIVDGPFRGTFLDDLANSAAAQSGGYRYDVNTGRGVKEPARASEPVINDSQVQERGQKRDKLLVRIPSDRSWTEVRQQMRRLSQLQPTIKYRQNTKNTTFLFEFEDYKLVRDVLGGGLLTERAAQKLDAHFEALTQIERTASDESLPKHTAEAIGGFNQKVVAPDGTTRPVELTYWQKKSLAWLEARDYKGVIGLGTGMGKTLVAIGAMQELRRKQGETRPFLVVAPPALAGNFAKDVYKFLEPAEAEALLAQTKILDYKQFHAASKSGTLDGKPFDGKQFGAAVFDEAQWIKNRKHAASADALAFKSDRKIVLTASVLKNSVNDIVTLSSIANNVDLNDKVEGKELRHLMRKFTDLHCQVVGGRVVAVRDAIELTPGEFIDPKHNLYTFVRSNILYADKRNDETRLPKLRQQTQVLQMSPELEKEYRQKAGKLTKLMRGMVSLYRDEGVRREYVDDQGRTRREIEPLAKDRNLGKVFGNEFKSLVDDINALSNNEHKLEQAGGLVMNALGRNPKTQTVLFTDSPEYVLSSAKAMSLQIPGKVHAAALAKEVRLFRNGKELTEYAGHKLPFKANAYRRDPTLPADAQSNREYPISQWQQFVLAEVIGKDTDVATSTLLGPTYQEGQNLQWANVGIHLDRDTWSRQNMEQREGRLWRKGQSRPVDFYNLDWVYAAPKDSLDRSLDEVRAIYEQSEGRLFQDVVVVPQETTLGAEWPEVRQMKSLQIDSRMLDAVLQPTGKNAVARGVLQ